MLQKAHRSNSKEYLQQLSSLLLHGDHFLTSAHKNVNISIDVYLLRENEDLYTLTRINYLIQWGRQVLCYCFHR